MSDKVLNVLRDLHDATGCPMLWCGTTDLVAYLERETGLTREPLAQIRRRIVICRDLTERTYKPDGGPGEPLYTVEEIRSIFAAGKLKLTSDALRTLTDLANLFDSGHLGACRSLLAMTVKLNERTADVITGDMLKASLGLMVNRRAMLHLGERLSAQRVQPVNRVRAG